MDGSEDGKWLNVKYEKVPGYCLYCKLQGHMENQCRNKARDERIKAQKEEKEKQQVMEKQEKVQKDTDDFHTISRRKERKTINKQRQTDAAGTDNLKQQSNTVQINNRYKGISINEPSEVQQRLEVDEITRNGKEKVVDRLETTKVQRRRHQF